jgi:hypothetical protein
MAHILGLQHVALVVSGWVPFYIRVYIDPELISLLPAGSGELDHLS